MVHRMSSFSLALRPGRLHAGFALAPLGGLLLLLRLART
jgi:hypothetical protein